MKKKLFIILVFICVIGKIFSQTADSILFYSNSSFQTTTNGASALVSDFIRLPSFTLGNNFTIETWFKLESFSNTNFPRIFDFGVAGATKTTLAINSSGNLLFIYGNSAVTANILPAVNIGIGSWNHYAVTVSGGNLVKVYVNGVVVFFTSVGFGTPVTTYTSNYLASQNDQSQAPTIGCYSDFRIWTQTRTAAQISKSTLRIFVPSNSDSLYYYLPLNNSSNNTVTESITNFYLLAGSSTWVGGALNAFSRIQNNGAKYKYDSSRQYLSGTYKNALVANEKIQYSINGGTTWVNVDTALNNLWVVKMPTTFRAGVVKVRSAILGVATARVFADFTIVAPPSALVYAASRIDVDEGSVNLINVSSINTGGGGTVGYSISSGAVTGISINAITGQLKADSIVPFGLYNVVVTASNIQGSTSATITINIKQTFKNRVVGFINNYFQTTSNSAGVSGDYINLPNFVLDSNFTVETWFKLEAGTGLIFPFIYNLGGWGAANLSQGLIMAAGISRTLDIMSWGVEANTAAPLDFTGYNLAAATWVHLAVVVKGRNTKVYVNGVLIKQYTNIGVPSNNNTFTNSRLGNGQSAGGTISTTLGKFQDFRVWKKARTALEIQTSYLTPVPISSDSLYYNILLNAPSIITTNNIINGTSINNVSTWAGAINTTSTVVSQGGTGAKYFYDTARQRLYGTISSALVLNEKIQYSINGGTTWTNVDTVFGVKWLVTLPITYKFATIKIRSSTDPTRVFQDYTFYSIPTISYSKSIEIDTFGTTGVSVVPTVSTSGITTCSITSGGVSGISINSSTGQISWTNVVPVGIYNLVISATNQSGVGTSNFTLNISSVLSNFAYSIDSVTALFGFAGNSVTPTITGGPVTYSFSNTTPAVSGITINSVTGVVSWLNSVPVGTYLFKVLASNLLKVDSSKRYKLIIKGSAPIISYSINNMVEDQNIADSSVSPTFNSTGLPLTFKIVSGGGSGININSASGVINWTSKVNPGTYIIIVQANNIADSDQTTFNLTINRLTDTILYFNNSSFQSNTVSVGGGGDYIQLPTLDMSGNYTIETWFKNIGSLGEWKRIFDFGVLGGSPLGILVGFPTSTQIGYHANGPDVVLSLPSNFITSNGWNHIAFTFDGIFTSLYINGLLVDKQSTQSATAPGTCTSNFIGRSNWAIDGTTQGQFMHFKIWKKVKTGSEILATYRGAETRNSTGLHYYLPLDEKLFTSRDIENNTILTNYSTSAVALGAASTVISQNNGTGAKYFVDLAHQTLSGKYRDTLQLGETIQVSYDTGLTWRNVKYASNNNWNDSLTSVFNGGKIKVRSVIGGIPTSRNFIDFVQIIKPSAPIINSVSNVQSTKAIISFDSPLKNGGALVTNYIVVSTPSNLTASGTSSPIEMSGLTNGVSYVFKMVGSNVAGLSDSSATSSTLTLPTSYSINTSVKNGSISAGPITVNIGDSIRITYTPTNNNYAIDSVIINNVLVNDSIIGYTFKNVIKNNTIRVVYKLKTALISLNIGLNGTVSTLGDSIVDYGTKQNYTITPDMGYELDTLFVNGIKVDSITSITFDSIVSNLTIKAVFKLKTFSIISSTGAGGTISPLGTSVVKYDSSIKYTITPSAGFVLDTLFVNGNKVDSISSYTFDTVRINKTIFAKFKVQTFTITSSAGTGGMITPVGSSIVKYDSSIKYTITPNAGLVLDTLFVNGIKVDSISSYTFDSVRINKTISAKFKVQTFTITATGGTGGSINPIGTSIVKYDSSLKYTITPSAGFVLDTLFVNGLKVDSISSYTFDTVTINKTIFAKFKLQTFTIISSAGTGGMITPVGSSIVKYDSSLKYTITPDAGFVLDTLFVNGNKVDSISSYTFDTVKINKTILAKFKIQTFTITATGGAGGSISPIGTSSVKYDSSLKYTITPNAGFVLDTLFVNGNKVDSISSYTFDSVRINKTIFAKFKVKTFTITATAGAGGIINPSGTSSVKYDSSIKYTITPNTGFVLDTLFVNGNKVDSISSYTFDTVTINKTIFAKFKVKILTITATAGAGGIINPSGTSFVKYDSSIKYTITPNAGFVLDTLFVNGNKVDSISSYTFDTLKANKTISAKFKIQTFTITSSAGSGGSINPVGSSIVKYDSSIKYTITPNTGFVLDTLFVNGIKVDSISSYTFDTVTINKTIFAKFKVQTFTITATAGAGGSISPIGTSSVKYDSSLKYTITPSVGFVLDTLFVNGNKVDSISSYTFDSVRINKTIFAKFKVKTFAITATAGAGGMITPVGSSIVKYDSSLKFTITPNLGFVIDTLFVNSLPVDSITSYTFDTVKVNKTIFAKFKVQTFTITATAGAGGAITPIGISIVKYDSSIKYTITPNAGFVLDTLFVNGNKVDSISSYTFDTVTINKTIFAKFKVKTFAITATAGAGGSINPSGTSSVKYDSSLKYTITPNAGFVLDTLFVNGNKVDSISSYTFDTVTINKTISAKFKVQTFIITATGGAGGAITPIGTSIVKYDSFLRYTITPNAGFVLDTLFVNGNKVDSISSYTFDSVRINKTIFAKFKVKTFAITATAGAGGSISPIGTSSVKYDSSLKYTITSNAGFVLDTLFVNGNKVDSISSYTFDTVTINKTIFAKFKVQTFTITATGGVGGAITPIGTSIVKYDSSLKYTITPDAGFVIDTIFVDSIPVDSISSYTFDSVRINKTISAKFKVQTFIITATGGAGGAITPIGTSIVKYDSSIKYTITPNAGFVLDTLFINGNKVDSISSYTFDTVRINKTIFAKFKVQTFTITATGGAGGAITPIGTSSVKYDSSLKYTITPNVGFVIDTLFVNGTKVDSILTYTFDSVKVNKIIFAKFKVITPPSKPLNVVAIAGNAQAIISFTSPIYNGGVAINKYIVEEVGGSIKDSNISSPVIINGLTNLQTYRFSVKAINIFGLVSDTSISNSIQPDNNFRFVKSRALNGVISADTTIALGGFRIIKYEPNIGFKLDSIYINDMYNSEITIDSINSYTFKNINGDSSIKVIFKLQTFTITSSAGTGGMITPVGSSIVKYDSSFKYTITPNTGFVLDTLFVNGNKVDSISSYTFDTVTINKTISAKFKVKILTITATAGAGGSINPSGTSFVKYDSSIKYTITPNAGFVLDTLFVNGNKVDSISSYTFDSVRINKTIFAKFKVKTFTITATAGAGGIINPSGTSSVKYDSSIKYTITPDAGFVLDTLFVNGNKVDSISSYTFDTVTINKTIFAKFKVKILTITATAGAGGSINPSGTSFVKYDSSIKYTITPNAGFVLDTLFVNGNKVDSISSYTFDSVRINKTIFAKFKVKTFTITATAGAGGIINPSGTSSVKYDSSIKYTITPNTGFVLDTLFVNGNKVDSISSYTFDTVTINKTIFAKFKVKILTITATAGAGGIINPSGTSFVKYDSSIKYTITPNAGFVLDTLFVNGLKVDSISNYTFDTVTINKTIFAKFKVKILTITATAGAGGIINPSGTSFVKYDSSIKYTITPNAGFVLDTLFVNGLKVDSISSYTFDTVTINKTIFAKFKVQTFTITATGGAGGGAITPIGTSIVKYDSSLKYTITPNAGFVLDTLFVNGNKVDSISSYTFDTVRINKTIFAKFKVKTFAITATAGAGGSISPIGTSSVKYDSSLKYTITSNAGFVLDTLFVNGLKVDSISSYTFDTVTINKTIFAKFKVQTFTITATAGAGGSISPIGTRSVKYDSSLKYTITPNAGFVLDTLFVNGNKVDSISSYTFDTVTINKTISAKFKVQTFTITATGGAGGAITPIGTSSVKYDSSLKYTITPNAGFVLDTLFVNGNKVDSISSYTFDTLKANKTISAKFKIQTFTITSSAGSGGSINPVGSSIVKYDSSIKYTITPNTGFVLDTLFVNGIKVDSISSYTFDTVTINKTIFAKFKVKTFTIISSAGIGGSISPIGTSSVKYDSSLKYTITPSVGFVLDTLFVNGNKVDSISSYTFDSVRINKTIFAKFKVKTFAITATAGAGGMITPVGSSIVKYDSSLKFTITPNLGFVIDTLFVNSLPVDSITSYTFDSVRINKTIFAKFKVKTFAITATAGAGGSINPSGTNIVKYDSSIKYTITPNAGFVLDTLFVNGLKVDSISSYTFDTVTINKTIFAKFKVQTFTITSSAGTGGMISPVGSSSVKYDSSLKYTITPNTGFVLDTLFVNGNKVDSISSYTFDTVTINKTIFAKFKVQTFTITATGGAGGAITPIGTSIVKYDSSLKYTITPNAGFVLDTLFVNGNKVDSISSYTFDSVRINKIIFAKFKVKTFTITATAGAGGSINPSGTNIVKYDSSIKYTITPNVGFVLDTLFVNGNKVDSISSYTFDTVTINKTIFAKFKVQTFTITATAGAGGNINPSGTNIVKYDSSLKYTITPNAGFVLDTLFVNGNKVDSISSYTFDTVTINKTIFAKFKVQTFTITATGGAGGAITPIGTSIVKYDSSLKYTITPDAGFVIDTIFVDSIPVDSISSYTFDSVRINKTISAKFKVQTFIITATGGAGGAITPIGTSIVKYDSSIKYTITPNAGFVLDTLFVNGNKVDSISSYTFDTVRINKTIFAKFKVQTFTITATGGAGGAITPIGTSIVKYDSSLKYTITPNAGFVLDTLFVNGNKVDSISSYTFDSVRINKTISAKFKVQTFTITATGGAGGAITPIGTSIVKYDSSIKYTITPDAGFVIDTIFVDSIPVDSISSYTFDTVTINKTISAKFKVQTFTITSSAGIGGSISPSGTSFVKYDSSLKYTITPNAGFVLDTLFVNGLKVDSISSYTFDSVTINKTIFAKFKVQTFTITATAGAGGSIIPIGTSSVKYDSSLKYTITPNAGFVLDTLFVNGNKVDSISSYTFDSVTINKTIFAKFKVQTFTITATAGAGGSISPIGTSSVKYDSSLKYTITPNAGFVLDTLFVNGNKVDSISSYTFDTVKINKTIFAKFKVQTFTITATGGAGGAITPIGTSSVKYDSSLKYTITPNAGFVLDTLFVNGNKVDSISSYTFDSVRINKIIFAKFKVKTFTITATAGAGGSINPSGTNIVKYDSSIKYTITPSAGFVLDTLFVNGNKVDSISSYTFDTVTINKTIFAKFKVQTFTITATGGAGGSISPIGTSSVKYDSSIKYTITPNAGFVLDTLFVNGNKVDSISSYTFDTVTINKTISAKFKVQTFTITATGGTGGMITPIGSSIVKYDSSLKYTITPNAGFVLDTLFVNGNKVDSISSYTFDTVTINKTISAKFKVQTFTITSSAGTGGMITPVGSSIVKYDSSLKYTITPSAGFVLDTLFVNGNKVDSISSYTFDSVRINKTIFAKFKVQTFTITATAGAGGSINPSGTNIVKYDSSINYTITPNAGFVLDTLFVNGLKVDSISSYTFDTVTINKTIFAKFKVQTFTITSTGGAGGMITPVGSSIVKYDSSLKYTITPSAGFVLDTLFVNGNKVDSISSYTFDTVTINKTIFAKFKVQTFTITSSAGTGGSISPIGTSSVKYDSSIKYTITPNAGFVLDTLFVNGNKVDSTTSYTFDTVKVNKTIFAKFKVQTFTITATAGAGGSINPSGTNIVKYDSSIKYTITPNAGFVLDTLFVNGNKVDSISSYTFDTVTINKTISAKFKIQTFTITSSAGTGGMITPVGSSIVKYDSSLKYTITPSAGFVLDTLFVNGVKVDSISSYTFDSVRINKTIFAKFKVQTFTITSSAGTGGMITPVGSSIVKYDSSLKYTITPSAGFVLDTLFVNGNKVDSISSYTFDSVRINKTIFAKFKVKTFTITATAGAGGIINPSGTSIVKYDSSLKYTITPNAGFVLDTLFVNGNKVDSISSYTFDTVTINKTISAKFKVQTFTITSTGGAGGMITPVGSSIVKYDSSLKYTITPNAGFVLDTLFVNGIKVDSISSYTFDSVRINKTIFAKFKVQTFTITATAGAGGSINPSGTSFVKYDSSIKYTITPNAGFVIDTLFVNGNKVDSILTYTFDSVQMNKTIFAKFKVKTFAITATAGTGGSISPIGTSSVKYDSSLKYTITPNAGFVIDTLFVNGIKVDSISSYTFDTVRINKTIFAKFKVKTFTITATAGAGGIINPSGTNIVKYDSSIKYTITPNAGFVLDTLFVNGNKVDSTTSYTFDTVKVNKTIFAKFKVQTFTITATAGAGGSINPSGTNIVKYDSSIKYTITPNAGFILDTLFVNGNKVDSISSYTFDTVTINKTISAKFKVQTFTITATGGAGGAITPIGTSIVKYDSSLKYTITPSAGFVLDTLFVNGNKVDSISSYTFDTVTINKTIFAKFKVKTFTITATAGAGGMISPVGSSSVKYDSFIKYTITPNAGFVIDTLFVNGNKVDSISSYTFDSVTINKTIFAKFKVQTFTITATAGAGGSISPIGTSSVKYDSSLKYTITPNAGFVLDTLFVNGNKVDSISSYTFDTVKINKTIFAKFKVQTFTITASAGAGGSINPSGTSSVKYDSSLKYTITPNAGFVLDTLFVNGNKADSISSYTFDTVTINKTISAKFKVQTFTIISSAGIGGSINPSGTSFVKYDSSLKYTITPNLGFVIDTIFVDSIPVDSISSYTFDSVRINKTISAKFKVQTFTITASAGTGGVITPVGSSSVKYDSSLNYTITPNLGFVLDTLFVNGNKVDSISSYTFDTVTINKTIFAKFKVQTFTITATGGAGGAITPIGTSIVKYDSSLKYTITPSTGFVLDTLFVNGNKVDSISSYTFDTVTINKTISAKFKVQTFTIISSAGTGGSISPSGTSFVKYDSSIKYTITPSIGFALDTLFVDGIKVDSISSYTFDTLKANKTISAKFKIQTFTITSSAGTGGMITPVGSSIVKYDSSLKYTITPNTGFVLDTLFVNGNKVDSISSYTFDTVTINKTIFAKFKVKTFAITATAGAGGNINPSGTSIVKYDSSLKYTITPSAGFVLDTLFVNGNKVDSISSYTFDTVTINKTIFAKFKVQTFTITSSVGTGGNINPTGTNIVKYDSSLNYTITPNLGFVLDTLFVNGNKVDSISSYTFDTVKVNKTIFAKFKVQTFTITATAGAGGSINPSGTNIVKYDSSIKYTITPNLGFVLDTLFVNGNKVDSISSYTFDTVTINKTIFANFKVKTFAIISSAGTGGLITPVGSSIVKYDSSLKYTITPNAGFVLDTLFVNGNKVDSISSYTFDTVTINKTISAKFKVQTFTITATGGTGGMITPIGSSIVKYDSSLKYTITPNAGFVLDTLFVNGNKVDSISSYTFDTVTINKTISAKFKVQTFTITSSAGTGGMITPVGSSIVKYDSSLKYTITPSAGFVLDTLFVNGNKVDSISSYTFDSVRINKTIFAKFKVQTFTITATAGAGGSISPIGTRSVKYDSSIKYTITPNAGFVIDTIFVDSIPVDSISSYTFDTVTINKTIFAKFKVKTFTITASVGTGGSISPAGFSFVKYDSSIKYTITPSIGFALDTLFVDGIKVDSISSYTFDTLKANKTISAKFKIQTYTITSSAGTGGSISPAGTDFVNYYSSLLFIITPNFGFVLDTLFVNDSKVDSISSYTFNNVTSNQRIFAKFKVIYDCSISRITPFINRVDNALMTNPFTFTKHKWYLDGNLIDSTTYNGYFPSKPGVYSIVGLDTNGCLSNFSKKYYYSQSCIIPAGRLGNAATIQSNIVENINQIVIKWCTDIIKDDLTILIVDLNGSIINEQKIPANTGTYILNKSLITNNQFIVQVISSNGEIIQTSDIIFKTK